VVTLGAIFAAISLSPEFSWTAHALSNLGGNVGDASTPTTRLIFNYGLILGGLVGMAFGLPMLGVFRNLVELAGVGLFGLVLISMSLIGVFPLQTDLHIPVAIAFYMLLSAALWTYGVGNVFAGDERRGMYTVALAVLNGTVWILWLATGDLLRPGLAFPELLGAFLFAVWAIATVLDVRDRLEASLREGARPEYLE
jgi:hypothetical membrane protein